MKNRIQFNRIPAFVMILCMMLGLTACDGEMQSERTTETETVQVQITEPETEKAEPVLEDGERTVYAKADAAGNVREITVETLQMDENGEEYRYKEDSDEALPVAVKIGYYLNDVLTAPEKLAGQSGKMKIRFDYENCTAEDEENDGALVPFMVISALALPADTFSNIEVENGEVISMEGQRMVVGFALPGISDYLALKNYEPTEELEIPDFVEITADVKDFKLAFTATIMTNGLFKELEDEDLDDLDDMADSMDDLKEAVRELTDGTTELYDGMVEFHGYLGDFSEGAAAVAEGTAALSEGLEFLDDNKDDLEDGVKALSKGVKALYETLTAMISQSQVTEDSEDNHGEQNSGEENVTQPTAEEQLDAVVESAIIAMNLTEEEADIFRNTIASLNLATDEKKTAQAQLLTMVLSSAAEQSTAAMVQTLTGIQTGVGELQKGSQALVTGVETFNDGIGELYDGSVELYEGTAELSEAGTELCDGFSEFVDGVKELKDGVAEFNQEGVQELEKLAGKQLRDIINGLRKIKEQDKIWQGFAGASGVEQSVRIILETEEIE